MHWTTHVVVGGALGYLIGRPAPALAAGFACHLVMDVTPHFDPDSDLGYVLDAAGGLAALLLIGACGTFRGTDHRRATLAGAAGSGLPDLELLVKIIDRDYPSEKYILPWHNGKLPHRQTTPGRSTAIQATLLAIMMGLAAARFRRASGTAEPGV